MTELKIIGGLIFGGIIIFSALKSLLHLGFGKAEPPRSYVDYGRAAIRGRDVFNGPGKPLSTSIGGGILAIFLWIFKIPYRIPNYFLSKSKRLKPKMASFLSGLIAAVFWVIFIRSFL